MGQGRRHRALLAALAAAWPMLAGQVARAQAQLPDAAGGEPGASQPGGEPAGAQPGEAPGDEPGDEPGGEEPEARQARLAEEAQQREAERAAERRADEEAALQRRAPARMVDRPTSAMPSGYAFFGVSHRGELMAALEVQFGGIAALGAGYDDRLLAGTTAKDAEVQGRSSQWFRMGVAAGRWFAQQPALDLTFERTSGDEETHAAELRLGATRSWRSERVGAIDLTAGVGLWEIDGNGARLSDEPLGKRVRPYGGVAWTPPSYPRTSLLLEGSFGPSVIDGEPRLDWRLGWGARYQVFSWSAIDLVVRNRQDAGLPGSTVMVRLSAQLD